MMDSYIKGVVATILSSVVAAFIFGAVTMYSNVNANTSHREKSEDVLSKLNDSVIRLEVIQTRLVEVLDKHEEEHH